MEIGKIFIPLRLTANLALELVKLRVQVLGRGSYGPDSVDGHIARLPGGVSVAFDIKSDTGFIETGGIHETEVLRGPTLNLTVPEDFAAFMTYIDKEIVKANPGFPTSGFELVDNIGQYLNIIDRAYVDSQGEGYRYPYKTLLKERLALSLDAGPWTLGPETEAFLDEAQGYKSEKLLYRQELETGKPAFSALKNADLAADTRWFIQVEDWTISGFQGRQTWVSEGLMWQKLETPSSIIAFETSIMRNGGQPVRGDTPPSTGRRLDDGKDYYVCTLVGYTNANIFVDVDQATGEIEAWAMPSWIEGMFESDTPRMLNYLENRILQGKAKTYR